MYFALTDPSIFINPPFLLQQLGGDFTLNCTPSDNISEIVWTRNDEIIDNDDDRVTYLPNDRLRHILTISNASYTDDANYTCALNSSGILVDAQTSPVTIFRGTHVSLMYGFCMWVLSTPKAISNCLHEMKLL